MDKNGGGIWTLPSLADSSSLLTGSVSIQCSRPAFLLIHPFVYLSTPLQEAISSADNYKNGGGMWTLPGLANSSSRLTMSVSMYRGVGGSGRPKTAPPDLPSLLLDARICYLGMPVSALQQRGCPSLKAL